VHTVRARVALVFRVASELQGLGQAEVNRSAHLTSFALRRGAFLHSFSGCSPIHPAPASPNATHPNACHHSIIPQYRIPIHQFIVAHTRNPSQQPITSPCKKCQSRIKSMPMPCHAVPCHRKPCTTHQCQPMHKTTSQISLSQDSLCTQRFAGGVRRMQCMRYHTEGSLLFGGVSHNSFVLLFGRSVFRFGVAGSRFGRSCGGSSRSRSSLLLTATQCNAMQYTTQNPMQYAVPHITMQGR
jgi:hypothetical protein